MKKIIIPVLVSLLFLAAGIFCGTLLPQEPAAPPAILVEEKPVEAVSYETAQPLVTTALSCGDAQDAYALLKESQTLLKSGALQAADFEGIFREASSHLGALDQYLYYLDRLCVEVDGNKYGAYVEEGQSPIGGGLGYSEIFTTGDYIVTNAEELYQATRYAEPGEVIFIPGGTVIDMTGHLYFRQIGYNIRPGVILASDRGFANPDGSISTGALLRNTSTAGNMLTLMEGARITGLVLEGPTKDNHIPHHTRAFSNPGYGSDYYYKSSYVRTNGIYVAGNNTQVDNCEIAGFGHGAVNIARDIRGVWVHHCYIHHNQAQGLGYGVCHGNSSESLVEYCLFNYNRHSIAATGAGKTGYIARFNVEMGESLGHCFDIHGGADRGEASNHAGDYCEMYNNTFLAEDHPYWLRGVPSEYQLFYRNNCLYPYETYRRDKLEGENVEIYDNIFGLDALILRP